MERSEVTGGREYPERRDCVDNGREHVAPTDYAVSSGTFRQPGHQPATKKGCDGSGDVDTNHGAIATSTVVGDSTRASSSGVSDTRKPRLPPLM